MEGVILIREINRLLYRKYIKGGNVYEYICKN